eukprot:856446-Heterocapsa_arctica.AAC.1
MECLIRRCPHRDELLVLSRHLKHPPTEIEQPLGTCRRCEGKNDVSAAKYARSCSRLVIGGASFKLRHDLGSPRRRLAVA